MQYKKNRAKGFKANVRFLHCLKKNYLNIIFALKNGQTPHSRTQLIMNTPKKRDLNVMKKRQTTIQDFFKAF